MFIRKKDEIQRLNLQAPGVESKPASGTAPAAQCLPAVHPARLEAVQQRAREIMAAGRIPESLFLCSTANGLLLYRPAQGQTPVMLLFSHPFSASDYLRATGTSGHVGQFKVEMLPELAKSWLASGVQAVVLDRCPRCAPFLSIDLSSAGKWSKEDFAKIWSHLRATRSVLAETRVRSAMNYLKAGSYPQARADLEYVRDHFDCGVPYLHQLIGLVAGVQQDEAAKGAAIERLKEFGPQFAGPLDFCPELLATASVGLMANFGMLQQAAS